MRIFVCVKQVPDTSGVVAVNPGGTLNRASMQTIINRMSGYSRNNGTSSCRRNAERTAGNGC